LQFNGSRGRNRSKNLLCGKNGWTNVELLSQGIHNQMRGVESVRQIDNLCIVGDSNFWQSRLIPNVCLFDFSRVYK
jgi:hypothetical protein